MTIPSVLGFGTKIGLTLAVVATAVLWATTQYAESEPPPNPPVVEDLDGGFDDTVDDPGQADRAPGQPVEGSYIVVMEPLVAASADGADAALAQRAVTRFANENGIPVKTTFRHALLGFATDLSEAQATELAEHPAVESIEQDRYIGLADVQTNPPWGLDRIDQRGIDPDNNYHFGATGGGVDIYVVDSGIRSSHSEFGDRVVGGYSVFGGPWDEDCLGHGTAVASVAAGERLGVAKEANIWSVRVFDCFGESTSGGLITALDWIAGNAKGPSVVNLSLAGRGRSNATAIAVRALLNTGVSVVAAAGNDNEDACDYNPANILGVTTVGALAPGDKRAYFPGWWGSNWGRCLNLFAPGANIEVAGAANDWVSVKSGGTSMAAPHVAGVIALYLETNPTASTEELRSSLFSTATDTEIVNAGVGSPSAIVHSFASDVLAPVPNPTARDAVGRIVAPLGISEGGGDEYRVRLEFDRAIHEPFEFTWAVAGNAADSDLSRTSETLRVLPEDLDDKNRLGLGIYGLTDHVVEGNETVLIEGSIEGEGMTLASSQFEVTIFDSDDSPVGDRQVLDDFEVDQGWDFSLPLKPASRGFFEIVDPDPSPAYNGTVYQPGTANGGSQALVTDGRAGSAGPDFDVDEGQVWARRNIEIPSNASTLELSNYFAHSTKAYSQDYLRISIDGVVVVHHQGTRGIVREPEWETVRIDARPFAGRSVEFEVVASDDRRTFDGVRQVAVIEAAVDDIVVWVEVEQPGPFECWVDAGRVSWTDAGQSKYWIYRAVPDGSLEFVWLGSTDGATSFVDRNPVVGSRYQVHYPGLHRVECEVRSQPSSD